MDYESDFAILTVVPEAWGAATRTFGEPTRRERKYKKDWAVWEIEGADGGKSRIIIDRIPDRSNLPALERTTLILNAWRPRRLILADIGGGFHGRDDLGLGDLVVATELEYYSFLKETEDGEELRSFPISHPGLTPREDLERLPHSCPGWTDAIVAPRPELAGADSPKILPGQIICGERLLSDPESPTVRGLATRYPKALAVDMESVGAGRAVLGAQRDEIFTQFGVVRGISDCIGKGEDNQATRDTTKPYAAAVAVAAVYAYIRDQPSDDSILNKRPPATAELQGAVSDADAYLEELRNVLSRASPAYGSSFRLTLRSTDARVDGSVVPEGDVNIERGEVLDVVMQDRLVAVFGDSGAGKSVLLDGIARQLASGGDPIVVRIDLKTGWSPSWAPSLESQPFGDLLPSSMEALLSASSPSVTVERLNQLAESHTVLILVDALNEVPPEEARKIRLTVGQYARQFPGVRVLATDRSLNADYRELRWTALELPELELDEVRHVINSKFDEGEFDRHPNGRKEILRIPFFLDRAIREESGIDFTSRAGAVEQFLRDGGLVNSDLEAAGETALAVLLRGETNFSQDDAESLEASGVLEKLLQGGFVSEGPAGLVFAHQLIHQCLGGRRLALNPEEWKPDTMDALTSFGASSDGLGMAIAAIEGRDERDRFLRIVYDWNWRAAVVTLSEAQAGDRPVSDAMEEAILAMIAEKRFDPVSGTRKRVESMLAKVGRATAEFLRGVNQDELYEYVDGLDHPESDWWAEWKEAFLRFDAAELLNERTIAQLGSDMPLVGWMIANSLRRVEGSDEASGLVRAIYRSHTQTSVDSRTVRWRAVHTLGAWPSRDNAELLIEALGDEHLWCRYGATRSAVEMAARTSDPELRAWIVARLAEKWRHLDPEPLSQLAWASRYIGADTGWPTAIRPVIEAVRDNQVEEERDRWDRRLATFDEYAAELEAGK